MCATSEVGSMSTSIHQNRSLQNLGGTAVVLFFLSGGVDKYLVNSTNGIEVCSNSGRDDSIHKKSFSFATGPSVVAMLILFSGHLNLRLGKTGSRAGRSALRGSMRLIIRI